MYLFKRSNRKHTPYNLVQIPHKEIKFDVECHFYFIERVAGVRVLIMTADWITTESRLLCN